MSELKYKRVLLKLSGEALGGKTGFGIDVDEAESIAARIQQVCAGRGNGGRARRW